MDLAALGGVAGDEGLLAASADQSRATVALSLALAANAEETPRLRHSAVGRRLRLPAVG